MGKKGDKRKSGAAPSDEPAPKRQKQSKGRAEAEAEEEEEVDIQALEAVDVIQTKIEAINAQEAEEVARVRKKFWKLKDPLLQERNKALEGIEQFWVTVVRLSLHVPPLILSTPRSL
eukprot:TRINITY_DN2279_c1_g1_i1.p1 TRINITY_DN2279_c1_g1~~TRINITY_DN2279_c1_g1_i1.p1  ORF type:complete len:117 (-),score=55.19 TRINITY_DN2279_c1_g1_i1:142-492(-)